MPKYMILYNTTDPASKIIEQVSPEQEKISMNDWMAWKDNAVKKMVKFDFGMPLQATSRLMADQMIDSESEVSGYSFMEGEKDKVIELLKVHPHLKNDANTIDILEVLPIKGM